MRQRKRSLVGIAFVLVGTLILLLVMLDFAYPIPYFGRSGGSTRGGYRTPEELKQEQQAGDVMGGLLGVVAIVVGGLLIRENTR